MNFKTLSLSLVFLIGNCSSEQSQLDQEHQVQSQIDKMFDFNDLDASGVVKERAKYCLYNIKTTSTLLNLTKGRDGGLSSVFTPCNWSQDNLQGMIVRDIGSCPDQKASRFSGLFVSAPNRVTRTDLPRDCSIGVERSNHAFDIKQQLEEGGAKILCFIADGEGVSQAMDANDLSLIPKASNSILLWQSKYALPVNYTVSVEDQVHVVLKPQYPAWGAEWDDVLLRWLSDFGFEPRQVACPDFSEN